MKTRGSPSTPFDYVDRFTSDAPSKPAATSVTTPDIRSDVSPAARPTDLMAFMSDHHH